MVDWLADQTTRFVGREEGFEFQLGILQGLLQRSEANNARIQNEITLVSPMYDGQYAFIPEAHEIRLSTLPLRGTARCSCR